MAPDRQSLAERVAALSPERRAALRRMLEAEPADPGPRPRTPPGSPAPLSFGQQRIWIIDRADPGTATYNEASLLPLAFPVDEAALAWALGEIGRRHEVLRSRFLLRGEEPVQEPMARLDIGLGVHDLRHLPAGEREAEAARIAQDTARIPFDLAVGPPIRAALLRLAAADHRLVLVVHHIAFDGWSLGLLVLELLALYGARTAGKPSPLSEPPFQYADFAHWQRRHLAGPTLDRQIDYWRSQLQGLQRIELPADRARRAGPSVRGGRVPLALPRPLEDRLAELARRENASFSTVMSAGMLALLHRLTNEPDLAIGCPTSGRDRAGLEGLIGFFVNILVLRADLGGDPSFSEVIARVGKATAEALAHQDVPFERLIDALQPPRDVNATPFFQVMFQLYDGSHFEYLPPGMEGTGVDTATSKFDLSIQFMRSHSATRGFIEYDADLFDRDRIDSMAAQFLRLLDSAAADPAAPISALKLLSPEEERRLLVEYGGGGQEFDRSATLPSLVRDQAAARPEATAVRFKGESLTYAALVEGARTAAARLRAAGARSGDVIGLHMVRSLDLPTAMLGIVEAGAAYLPLDVHWPAERLLRLLADAGAKLVVAADPAAAALEGFDGKVLAAAELAADAGGAADSDTAAAPASDDLAYVIYTSGTTGTPKAVEVSHRNMVQFVQAGGLVDWRPGRVMLHFSPLAFDASVFEIWGCLCNGGTLAIHPPDLPSLSALGEFIREERVEAAFLTTALCRQMIEDQAPSMRRLDQLLTGGETMTPDMAAAAWRALPQTRVLNCYGPAECTVIASAWAIDGSESPDGKVPIGRPIGDARCYVLDRYGNPAPVGVPGELHIGGAGVARYRPGAAAEEGRFVEDPFAGASGARLYRTGDIAAWRSDGALVFQGRRDRQVKLSGYRIELGEIESAAAAHPAVSLAAAVAASKPLPHLALFAVPAAGMPITAAELRRFLGERLPRHMVPATIDIRGSLPLAGGTKVDGEALVREAEARPVESSGPARPESPVERAVAAIWAELLERDEVGLDDNFFDLGGHSLLAMRLLSRVREALGIEVRMASFFDEPTVRSLARLVAPAGSA